MKSSEQLLVPGTVAFECTGWRDEEWEIPCIFAGRADATYDPETKTAQWDCPVCETEYAEPRER